MPDFHSSWQDIPIFTKTYELYKTFYEFLPSIPKKDKFTFAHRCEVVLLDILEDIILASNLPRQDKLPILKRASNKVDVLQVLFKLGKDLKIFDIKKFQLLEGMLREIGKMLGGWIKTTSI